MKASGTLTVSLLALLSAACATLPPRPVPLPEGQAALPAWHPEPAWNAIAKNERVVLEGKVVFSTGNARIGAAAEKVLAELVSFLGQNADVTRIRIEGHTDLRAGEEYNAKLSELRALAVADWLVDHGIDRDRIVAVAFGEGRPLWTGTSRAALGENRRAAFHVVEISGHRYEGEDPTAGGLALNVKSKEEREAEKRVGVVPRAEPVKVVVEGDVIKPAAKPKLRDPLEEEPPAPPPPAPPPAAEPSAKPAAAS